MRVIGDEKSGFNLEDAISRMMSATVTMAGMQLSLYRNIRYTGAAHIRLCIICILYRHYTDAYMHCTIRPRPIRFPQLPLISRITAEDVEFIHTGIDERAKVGVIDDRPFIMGIVRKKF